MPGVPRQAAAIAKAGSVKAFVNDGPLACNMLFVNIFGDIHTRSIGPSALGAADSARHLASPWCARLPELAATAFTRG
jgi:hypothetical protein